MMLDGEVERKGVVDVWGDGSCDMQSIFIYTSAPEVLLLTSARSGPRVQPQLQGCPASITATSITTHLTRINRNAYTWRPSHRFSRKSNNISDRTF